MAAGLLFSNRLLYLATPQLATPVRKDTGSVRGRIIDEADGEPVVNASIRIGARSIVAKIDGTFSINLPRGV